MKHNGLEDADIMSVYKRLAEKYQAVEKRKALDRMAQYAEEIGIYDKFVDEVS
jgi:hypothetical protein